MDISDIQLFLALAKYRNFTEAAEACAISQSALSKHLSKLEAELDGISLVDRSKRPVALTAAGSEFLQYAERFAADYDDLTSAMRKYVKSTAPNLRIGSIPVMARFGILDAIEKFDQFHHELSSTEVIDRISTELLPMLDNDQLDAIILILPHKKDLGRKYTCFRLFEHPLRLLVSNNHPLAKRSSVTLNELRGEKFAVQDEKLGVSNTIQSALLDAHVPKQNIRYYRNVEMIINDIVASGSCALLSEKLAKSYKSAPISVLKTEPKLTNSITLVIRNTPRVDARLMSFIDFMQSDGLNYLL